MKRVLAILLVMLLCLPAVAIGEEFVLRNGIVFGDSMDDVLTKETEPIAEVDRERGVIRTEPGQISNIYGTFVEFVFNDDGKLKQMNYRYPAFELDFAITGCYDLINEGLVEKYGKPLSDKETETVIQRGLSYNGAFIAVFSGGYVLSSDDWFVDDEGYSIKIEHISYYDGSNKVYEHNLSYAIVTDEELQSLDNERQENKNSLDSQL